MDTTDTAWRWCPADGARWLPTATSAHPHALHAGLACDGLCSA